MNELHKIAEDELRAAYHAQFVDPIEFAKCMLGCAYACLLAAEVACVKAE